MRPPMKPLKPLDEALADLLAKATPLPGTETVTTFDADGRVLAQNCISALQVPPQDNSSMDGYAVRCADVTAVGVALPITLPVSQRIAAGSTGDPPRGGGHHPWCLGAVGRHTPDPGRAGPGRQHRLARTAGGLPPPRGAVLHGRGTGHARPGAAGGKEPRGPLQ